MVTTVDTLYREALGLSNDSRVVLAERLIESVDPDPAVIELHLEIVSQRLKDLDNGTTQSVPGPEGFQRVREAVSRRAQP
jgi:hypothetical protein